MEIQNLKDLKNALKTDSIKGSVIVYGDEKKLIKESINNIYGLIKSFQELNIINLESENIDFDSILNACETIPFMSDKKIIHLKNPSFLVNTGDSIAKEIIQKLSNYIKNIPEGIILLLTSEGEVDEKSDLLKTIKNIGTVVKYKILKGESLQKWTLDFLRNKEKDISKSDLLYLISEVGASTDKLSTELEKLCSYAIDEAVITRSHIDEIIHKSLESNIFKMVDNITKKDAEGSMIILEKLLFQKEDYTRILGMIIRQFRLLYTIKQHLIGNKTLEEIRRSLKLNEYVLQNLLKQSKNHSEKSMIKSLNICLETDFRIKSGKVYPEMALELLIVELCK